MYACDSEHIVIFYLNKVCVMYYFWWGWRGEFEIGHSWEQLTVNDAVNAVLIQTAPTRSGFVFWWKHSYFQLGST